MVKVNYNLLIGTEIQILQTVVVDITDGYPAAVVEIQVLYNIEVRRECQVVPEEDSGVFG